ncbi:hypothetical protein HPP92_000810 [Vanilla planifolia]|uniref:At4g15545-like C-terminal domain-containing protein n=1 Tax=Vanilla planifolia TaxID=51239 RepID=A0A835S2E9_VANPL|nr:hypothetical protein HPP92_000948 [Vanilla planifolia]KAG0500738.1 hypothetical protein HPP92_000810 [Vanilla planifolia]
MAETRVAKDFHIPEEILSVIPTDPYEQLDLARKITSLAIASRVSKLESEADRMRQKVAEKDCAISELQARILELENMIRETDARLRIVLGENIKLSKERDSLVASSKKMSRDLAKLETFKKHLIQSLNDESVSPTQTVDIGTCELGVTQSTSSKDGGSASLLPPNPHQKATHFSHNPTPKITSNRGSPRGFSTVATPNLTSGMTSPTKANDEGNSSISPWYPSSEQSSAANSPPRGRSLPGFTPRIDGKEFFRQARSRLSYEQFAAFLANIKELNGRRQSREETLQKTEEIFGADNKDLYRYFQGLLNRSLP